MTALLAQGHQGAAHNSTRTVPKAHVLSPDDPVLVNLKKIYSQQVGNDSLPEPPQFKGRPSKSRWPLWWWWQEWPFHSLPFPVLALQNAVYAGVRQVVNLDEILEKCNDPTHWPKVLEGTKWKGVECRPYRFGKNLYEGMAVAQQADVFISLHGSGEMNTSE